MACARSRSSRAWRSATTTRSCSSSRPSAATCSGARDRCSTRVCWRRSSPPAWSACCRTSIFPGPAARHPAVAWGDPSSWSGFRAHLLRREYGTLPAGQRRNGRQRRLGRAGGPRVADARDLHVRSRRPVPGRVRPGRAASAHAAGTAGGGRARNARVLRGDVRGPRERALGRPAPSHRAGPVLAAGDPARGRAHGSRAARGRLAPGPGRALARAHRRDGNVPGRWASRTSARPIIAAAPSSATTDAPSWSRCRRARSS